MVVVREILMISLHKHDYGERDGTGEWVIGFRRGPGFPYATRPLLSAALGFVLPKLYHHHHTRLTYSTTD